ncbi:hypothetical protein AeRB84_013639 [Aphanomyces euteiches]|nr:hypothetical protein AeRB84_013639 [Aphanomyces euteiches]
MPSEEEKDEEDDHFDTQDVEEDGRRGRRSSRAAGQKPAKRVRPSLASTMVTEMKAFRESGKEELNMLKESLASLNDSQHMLNSVEISMATLHTDFEHVLEPSAMSFAYEVVENQAKAIQFVRMRGEARAIWLRHQIQIEAREHNEIVVMSEQSENLDIDD